MESDHLSEEKEEQKEPILCLIRLYLLLSFGLPALSNHLFQSNLYVSSDRLNI